MGQETGLAGIVQATLESGKNYYFQSLSLSGGAALNVNGANVFVKTLTMQDSSKLQGTGTLNANSVTLNEGATLSGLAIRVHDTLAVAVNQADQVAAARFQPHSLNSLTLGAQSVITLANGRWAIRTLTMKTTAGSTSLIAVVRPRPTWTSTPWP